MAWRVGGGGVEKRNAKMKNNRDTKKDNNMA